MYQMGREEGTQKSRRNTWVSARRRGRGEGNEKTHCKVLGLQRVEGEVGEGGGNAETTANYVVSMRPRGGQEGRRERRNHCKLRGFRRVEGEVGEGGGHAETTANY